MQPSTGMIFEGTVAELKAEEERLNEKLARIPMRDIDRVRSMTTSQRKGYAAQLQKRRRRAAEARKMRRKQRRS